MPTKRHAQEEPVQPWCPSRGLARQSASRVEYRAFRGVMARNRDDSVHITRVFGTGSLHTAERFIMTQIVLALVAAVVFLSGSAQASVHHHPGGPVSVTPADVTSPDPI